MARIGHAGKSMLSQLSHYLIIVTVSIWSTHIHIWQLFPYVEIIIEGNRCCVQAGAHSDSSLEYDREAPEL